MRISKTQRMILGILEQKKELPYLVLVSMVCDKKIKEDEHTRTRLEYISKWRHDKWTEKANESQNMADKTQYIGSIKHCINRSLKLLAKHKKIKVTQEFVDIRHAYHFRMETGLWEKGRKERLYNYYCSLQDFVTDRAVVENLDGFNILSKKAIDTY